MIQAEVEGIGTLEFPDDTDPAVVQQTVKRMVSGQGAQTASPSERSPFVEGLARGAKRTGELWAERWREQGENAIAVLRALGPEARPFPGENAVTKGLNILRVPLAPAEAVMHPLGAAIQSATETVTEPFGVSREKAGTVAGIVELLAGLGVSFAPTGTSSVAKVLQGFGLGRATPAAREAERMRGVTREAAKGGFPNIPLSMSDIIESNSNAYLADLFRASTQGGKKVKPDKVFKKLSNRPPIEEQVQAFDDAASRAKIGKMGGQPATPGELPPELLAVSKGEAPAFLIPPATEGTVPTVGEQLLAGKNLQALAKRLKVGYFRDPRTGAEVLFNPTMVKTSQLKQAAKADRLAEVVNGPGTSPKPPVPTEAVVVRNPDGTEIRTILTDTPEKTQAAVKAQPPGTQVEVMPFEEVGGVLQERTRVGPPVPPIETPVPTTLATQLPIQPPSGNAAFTAWMNRVGLKMKQENAGRAILEHLDDTGRTPRAVVEEFWGQTYDQLPPEVQVRFQKYIKGETSFQPGSITGVDASGGNVIARTWQEVYPPEVAGMTAAHLEGTERGLISLMEIANMRTSGRVPRRFRDLVGDVIQERMALPAPLQPKAPQVEHGDLLAGFNQAAPGPPKLPLGEEPHGTVELGMGLPVRQIGKAMKNILGAFDDDTRPVGMFQSGRVQLNRAAPGEKIGDSLMNAITEEREWKGTSTQIVQGAGMSKLTRQELINMLQVQEGRARPMNAKVASAVNAINLERDRYSQGLQQVGAKVLTTKTRIDKTTGATTRERFWKPYEPRTNYVPMIPDNAEMVKYSAEDLAKQVMQFNRGLDAQDARHAAEVMLARAKDERIPGTVPERIIELVTSGNPHASSLHARTGLVLPDVVRLLPDKAWPAYFNATSREIPLARHLGPGDAKIDALRRANSVRPDKGIAEALDTFDYWRGSKTRTTSERFWDKLIALGRNATTMRFMGPTTAVKQASQGIQVGAELSTKNFVRGIKGAFGKANSEEAGRSGAHLDDLMQELRDTALTLSEEMHPSSSKLDKAVIASERGASAVSRISQITRHDQFWRRAAYLGAKYDLQDAVVAAQKGTPKALSLLKEHGLTPAATPQQIQRAAAAFSAKVNLTSDPIALPAFIYKMPTMRLVTHLNRFTIGQQQRMVRDFAVPLAKAITSGDKAAMQRHGIRTAKLFGYGVVGGEVLADTLRTIAGRPDDRPGGTLPELLADMANWRVPPMVLATRIADNLAWAALLGYAQLAKEALFDTSTGGTASRLTSLALGPVGSSVIEGATRVANLAKADTEKSPRTGKSEFDRAKTDAWRTGIGSLTGVGRTVSQWIFPHTESSDRRRTLAEFARLRNRPRTPENIKKEAVLRRRFLRQHGKNISPAALLEALQDYNR